MYTEAEWPAARSRIQFQFSERRGRNVYRQVSCRSWGEDEEKDKKKEEI